MPRGSRPPRNFTFAAVCVILVLVGALVAREAELLYRDHRVRKAVAELACLAAIAEAEHWVRTWNAAGLGAAKVRADVLRSKLEAGCDGERVEVEYRRIVGGE